MKKNLPNRVSAADVDLMGLREAATDVLDQFVLFDLELEAAWARLCLLVGRSSQSFLDFPRYYRELQSVSAKAKRESD